MKGVRNMIYKKMSGRLGNQMFQYAALRAFQLKYRPNDKIILDFCDVYKQGSEEDGFYNTLKQFNLPDNVQFVNNMKLPIFPKILLCFYKFLCLLLKCTDFSHTYPQKRNRLERILAPFYMKNGVYIYTDGFYNFNNCNKKNIYFYGFFESSKYFEEIIDILRKEFVSTISSPFLSLLENIKSSNSVCVSVRAGDFLTNKFVNDYYVCKPQYFYKSIEYFTNKLTNPVFYIFSDDIEWVKKNLIFSKELNVVFEPENLSLFDKISLMSSCKHFILSNSSFSFWTQILSDNNSKIVVAPSRWSNKITNPDIYDDTWVKINVDH